MAGNMLKIGLTPLVGDANIGLYIIHTKLIGIICERERELTSWSMLSQFKATTSNWPQRYITRQINQEPRKWIVNVGRLLSSVTDLLAAE